MFLLMLPIPLFHLAPSSEKGIQLFQVDKYIYIALSHSICVLSLYKWRCNTAHFNKPALKPHSSSHKQIKVDAVLLLFCQP